MPWCVADTPAHHARRTCCRSSRKCLKNKGKTSRLRVESVLKVDQAIHCQIGFKEAKMVEQTDSLAGSFSAKETTDTQYGMGILEGKPYQGLDASSWAIFVHNPDLRMQRKSIQEPVDVLGLSSTQLLKDFDLVKGSVDGNIFRMGIVIFGIGIENLQGDQLTAAEIRAAWRELSASTSKEKQAYSTGANRGQLERVWGEVRWSTARIVNKRKTGER